MRSPIRFSASRTYTPDIDEADCKGVMVMMQIGPLVFEFWVALREKRPTKRLSA